MSHLLSKLIPGLSSALGRLRSRIERSLCGKFTLDVPASFLGPLHFASLSSFFLGLAFLFFSFLFFSFSFEHWHRPKQLDLDAAAGYGRSNFTHKVKTRSPHLDGWMDLQYTSHPKKRRAQDTEDLFRRESCLLLLPKINFVNSSISKQQQRIRNGGRPSEGRTRGMVR